MKAARQRIKSAETEADELKTILAAVGDALRKSGLTYAQFKKEFLRKDTKAETPSHASR